MKQNRGRGVILWLICAAALWGGGYRWNVLKAPESLYVGQSGVIRYECSFDSSAANYTIEFKPASTDTYKAEVLTQRDQIVKGKRVQTFDVLVTPLREGLSTVRLNALVRHTTFASIENATIGRDNVKKYDFNDEPVVLPPVAIRVNESGAALSGRVTMEARIDRQNARAYEPVHLSLFIRGEGNLDRFVPFELNISGVKVFAEPAQKQLSLSPKGYEGEIRQEFALVSDSSYVIPPLSLEVFDTASQSRKMLQTPPIRVGITEGFEPENLLDAPLADTGGWIRRYALYGALIVFGIVLGEGVRRLWRILPSRKEDYFWERAKNPKELAMILALRGEKRYEAIIDLLETGKISLAEAKKGLRKLG